MKLPGESDVTGSAREPTHDALSGAVAARDRGDSVRAEALCREALAAHPNDAAAWAESNNTPVLGPPIYVSITTMNQPVSRLITR